MSCSCPCYMYGLRNCHLQVIQIFYFKFYFCTMSLKGGVHPVTTVILMLRPVSPKLVILTVLLYIWLDFAKDQF